MASSRASIKGRKDGRNVAVVPDGLSVLDSVRNSLNHMGDLINSTKHAMSEYIQIQKMNSMETLATGIAHGINSCLLVLHAETRLIMRNCCDEKTLNRVGRITRVLDDLESLVGHLNQLGPEEIAKDLLPRDVSVEVSRVLDAVSSSFSNKNIVPHVSTTSMPLPVLLCQGDMWRILNNLLRNAQEAMPDGGDLLIGTFRRQVDSEYCRKHGNARTGTFAVITVTDHGKGIPPDMLDKIIDPLFTTKTDGQLKGRHGWGLAVVYALTRRRGGWIDVSSQVGQGTTFEVFLPLYTHEEPEQQ